MQKAEGKTSMFLRIRSQFFVVLMAMLFCSVIARAQDDEAEERVQATSKSVPLHKFPAHAWTGRELVLWDGRRALALDPNANSWRKLAANAQTPIDWRSIEMQCISNNQIVACFTTVDRGIGISRYLLDEDRWTQVDTGENGIPGTTGGPSLRGKMSVEDSLRMDDRALFFIAGNYTGDPVMGITVDLQGNVKKISSVNAPAHCSDSLVCTDGRSVLYWGYWSVGRGNAGATWDMKDDTWQPTRSGFGDRYSFGYCCTGSEAVIFGGAHSSAFGWIIPDGLIYSFETHKWNRLPLYGEHAPCGRRDFHMCWTGEEVFVWGGNTRMEPDTDGLRRDIELSDGSLYNPKTYTWRPVSDKNAPSARSLGICVWTGKEVLVWGGYEYPHYLYSGYAYDPASNVWRELPEPPGAE